MKNLIENIRHNCRNDTIRLAFTEGIPEDMDWNIEIIEMDDYLQNTQKPLGIQLSINLEKKAEKIKFYRERFACATTIEYNR